MIYVVFFRPTLTLTPILTLTLTLKVNFKWQYLPNNKTCLEADKTTERSALSLIFAHSTKPIGLEDRALFSHGTRASTLSLSLSVRHTHVEPRPAVLHTAFNSCQIKLSASRFSSSFVCKIKRLLWVKFKAILLNNPAKISCCTHVSLGAKI